MGADPPDIVALFEQIDVDHSGDLNRKELQVRISLQHLRQELLYKAEAEAAKLATSQAWIIRIMARRILLSVLLAQQLLCSPDVLPGITRQT